MILLKKVKYIAVVLIGLSLLFSSCFKNDESTKDSQNTDPTNQTEETGFLKQQSFDSVDIQTENYGFSHPLIKVKGDKALAAYAKEIVVSDPLYSKTVNSAIYASLYTNGQWSTPVEVFTTDEYAESTAQHHDAVINKNGIGGMVFTYSDISLEKFRFRYFDGTNWTYNLTIDGIVGIQETSRKRTSPMVVDSNGVVYIAYLKKDAEQDYYSVISRFDVNGLVDTKEFNKAEFVGSPYIVINDNDEIKLYLKGYYESSGTKIYSNGIWSDTYRVPEYSVSNDSIFLHLNNDGTAHIATLDSTIQHFYFDGQEWNTGHVLHSGGEYGYPENGHAAVYQNTFLIAYENLYKKQTSSYYFDGTNWSDDLKVPTGGTEDPDAVVSTLAYGIYMLNYQDYFISTFNLNGILGANYYKNGWHEVQKLKGIDNPNNTWDDYSVGINNKGEIFIVGHNNFLENATMFAAVYTFEAK